MNEPNEIQSGRTRTDGFSKVYHELFDCYQPFIGDKATLYYTYLLRFRNNEAGAKDYGKSYRGRKRAIEDLSVNYTQLKRLDSILEAFDLVRIERKPTAKGRPLIVYYVNEPIEAENFEEKQAEYIEELRRVCAEDSGVFPMLGKRYKQDFSTYE